MRMDLHLLRSEELDPPLARLHGEGDGKVAKTKGQGFRYEPGEERVYINPDQYFEPFLRRFGSGYQSAFRHSVY